jgi:hypothetical protein
MEGVKSSCRQGVSLSCRLTRVIVDTDMQRLVACVARLLRAICRDAVAWLREAWQLLGVDVQQLPRALALVTWAWRFGLQRRKSRQVGRLADAAYCALGQSNPLSNGDVGQPMVLAQRLGALDLVGRAASRALVRA